jgi:hypothetical protein
MVVHRRCNNHHPHCTSVSISTLPEANVTNQNSGFFVFPDVPSRKKPRFLEESEHTLARNRLEGLTVPVLIGISLLVAWDVGENGRLAAFILCGFEGGESLQPLFINGSLTRRSFNSGLPNDHELGVRRHG